MMYEILNDKGEVINTIVADQAFVNDKYPGKYRAIEDSLLGVEMPVPEDPLHDIKAKLVTILKNQDKIITKLGIAT